MLQSHTPKKTLMDALYITLIFTTWYLSTICFDIYIYKKQSAQCLRPRCHPYLDPAHHWLNPRSLWLFRIHWRPSHCASSISSSPSLPFNFHTAVAFTVGLQGHLNTPCIQLREAAIWDLETCICSILDT
jgi:hypothetical protein